MLSFVHFNRVIKPVMIVAMPVGTLTIINRVFDLKIEPHDLSIKYPCEIPLGL